MSLAATLKSAHETLQQAARDGIHIEAHLVFARDTLGRALDEADEKSRSLVDGLYKELKGVIDSGTQMSGDCLRQVTAWAQSLVLAAELGEQETSIVVCVFSSTDAEHQVHFQYLIEESGGGADDFAAFCDLLRKKIDSLALEYTRVFINYAPPHDVMCKAGRYFKLHRLTSGEIASIWRHLHTVKQASETA